MPLLHSDRKGLGALIEGSKRTDTPALETLNLPRRYAGARPAFFTLEEHIPADRGQAIILNQGSTNACVAHAFAAAIAIIENRHGLPYSPISRLFAYYHARREMGGGPLVFDTGTFLRTCAHGLTHFGVPDETHWPFSEFTLKVNLRPSFDALRWAHPRAGGKYAKIYQRGEARIPVIQDAVMSGCPVAFGTEVGKAFLDNAGSPYVVRDDSPVVGGHAMLIIGWGEKDGDVWFRVLNSWGSKWRDGGLCWLHQSLITGVQSDDFHVINGWNRLTEAKVVVPGRKESPR